MREPDNKTLPTPSFNLPGRDPFNPPLQKVVPISFLGVTDLGDIIVLCYIQERKEKLDDADCTGVYEIWRFDACLWGSMFNMMRLLVQGSSQLIHVPAKHKADPSKAKIQMTILNGKMMTASKDQEKEDYGDYGATIW